MNQKKIVVFQGHTDDQSLCRAIADTYEESAKAAGHSVERYNVGELTFDPILHNGYRTIQETEPDLKRFQESLKNADHFVVIYPNWWSGPPAIVKGFFDRVWLPGFAYRYIKLSNGTRSPFWHRLMRGKTARVIVTTGVKPLYLRIMYGNFVQEVSIAILWFAGFKVEETIFGPSDNPPETIKNTWLAHVRDLASRAR